MLKKNLNKYKMFTFNSLCRLRGQKSVHCTDYCEKKCIVKKNNVLDKNACKISKAKRNAGYVTSNKKTVISKVICK